MSTLLDYRQKQDALLKDGAQILGQDDKDLHIAQAVRMYSRLRPREKAFDIAGNDGYEFSLPTDWSEDFSAPRSLEYPQGQQQPEFLPLEDVRLYRTPTGLKLRLLRDTVATGQTARLLYTLPHTVSDALSTIPAIDEDAVATLAASLACEALAAHYAQTADPTITADAVNYRTKSGEYAARAKQLRGLFREHLGIKESDLAPAASATRDWHTNYAWGEDRLGHPRDRR